MPAVMKQTTPSVISATGYSGHVMQSTELNLSSAAFGTVLSPEIDNSVTLYGEGSLYLDVTFSSSPTAGGIIAIYMVPSFDASTYPQSVTLNQYNQGSGLLASFSVDAVTTQQVIPAPYRRLWPGKFKLVAYNNTSQAISGTPKLYLYGHNWQSV